MTLNLKNVMLINALTSGATGIILLAASNFVAGLFGTSYNQPFVETGIFLFVFSIFVFFVARQAHVNVTRVRSVILMDMLWVVASFTIVVLQPFDLSFIGYLLVALVAIWVGAMAVLQFIGLRAIQNPR